MTGVVKYVEKINAYCLGLVSLQLKQWSAFHEIEGTLITWLIILKLDDLS